MRLTNDDAIWGEPREGTIAIATEGKERGQTVGISACRLISGRAGYIYHILIARQPVD